MIPLKINENDTKKIHKKYLYVLLEMKINKNVFEGNYTFTSHVTFPSVHFQVFHEKVSVIIPTFFTSEETKL